jgi:predicted  nucleic acid-binding Zn-ribbon protein
MTDEIEQLREDLEQLRERYEQETKQLRNNIQQLHEEMVATAAVERVLLEYGIDTDTVDAILEDIEAVDSRLRSGDDE